MTKSFKIRVSVNNVQLPLQVSVALLLSVIAFTAGPILGQKSPGCAECEFKTHVFTTAHIDQKKCPGPNAVVCDYDYDRYFAKCTTRRGPYKNCKVASRKSFTPTRNYAPGVCGFALGFGYVCPIPTAGIAWVPLEEQYCTGQAWGIDNFLLGESHTLNIETPRGPTLLVDGLTELNSTLIGFDVELIEDGLEQSLFEQDGEFVYLNLTIESDQPGVSFKSSPEASVEIAHGILIVDHFEIEDGQILMALRVPLENLGAFAGYAVDIGGLMTGFESGAAIFTAPKVEEKPTLVDSKSNVDALSHFTGSTASAELTLFVSLSSGGDVLVAGSGLAGIAY